MIKDIYIENFRCFEHTKIEGFEKVNLIGGKNNSGKTALLEAMSISQFPELDMILLLTKIRDNYLYFSKFYPEKIWDNLFFNHKLDVKGKIQTHDQYSKKQDLILSVTRELLSSETIKKIDDIEISNSLFEKSDDIYNLKIYYRFENNEPFFLKIGSSREGVKISCFNRVSFDMLRIDHDLYLRNIRDILSYSNEKIGSAIQYISASFRLNQKEVIREYSYAELENRGHYLLNILKKIDPNIEDIKIFSIRDPVLYLRRKNETFLPISVFGDAINRVTEIIIRILNNQSSIILIDEIENGIHYTNHRDFWKALFELSEELDVQIFATTHSLEMIQAFRDIGIEKYTDSAAYFEMAKNPRTDRIIGIKHELEMLDYALKRKEGVRGE